MALVGLETYSEYELAPPLQEIKYCRLTAIVTGAPQKAEKWSKKSKIPQENIYSYDNFEKIKENDELDIIYTPS